MSSVSTRSYARQFPKQIQVLCITSQTKQRFAKKRDTRWYRVKGSHRGASMPSRRCYWCSMGSSGSNSSTSPSTRKLSSGGCTIPLKTKVEYTSRAKPTIWRNLNDSQPRPSDTIHMNNVRQVSIVDRDVALTLRVTDRPKKLKPLKITKILACNLSKPA